MKIGFVGAGNMGGAIINGLIKSNSDLKINVNDHNDSILEKFAPNVALTTKDAKELITNSDIILLAIKPYMYKDFLNENKELLKGKIIISIAAGISSKFMATFVDKFVLTMPNTPASVGLGMTSIVKNDLLSAQEFSVVESVFSGIGKTMFVQESDLELMICMAGSSPAYFELVIEAMSAFAQAKGMDSKTADLLATYVMNATSKMQLESDLDPRTLTNNVCSPNGTTEKAVQYFDQHGLKELFNDAMQACYDRAAEMKSENDESIS